MTLGRQAGGVDEVAREHAQLLRVLVHHLREDALGTSDVLGQRDARVVAGLHDHPHQQILDPHALCRLRQTCASPGMRQACSEMVTSSSSWIWP